MAEDRFFDEFADDFFAESTEHLAALRRGLLSVEEAAQHGEPLAGTVVSEVMRSLHTLKGLNGMVGLTDAAQVAHSMEEAIRSFTENGATPQSAEVGLLFSAARMLESCLAAYRMGTPAPDVSGVIEELRTTAPRLGLDAASLPGEPAEAEEIRQLYRFTFMPSAELAERGVGVEVVRARLQSLGEIRGISPRVAEGGSIAFDFTVLAEPERQPAEEWRADAIDWELVVPARPAHAAAAQPASTGALPRSNLVRVDLSRLDDLMLLVGDLVMSRARLEDGINRLRADRSNSAINLVEEAGEALERQLRDLRTAVMRVRLVPMGEVFERMRFVTRDVAGESGKQARVEVVGGKTEIDKVVVERMMEPLLHLVRNAVSHGLETPDERIAAGKDPIGRIMLRAHSIGDTIVVQVEDDGRGLDFERIREIAIARGALPQDAQVDSSNVIDILSGPGFSTRAAADLASGRGVGMDVVRTTVRELGGDLRVESYKGRGTCFTIDLPLTLMIVDALLVSVGDETIAVPQPNLREVLQIEAAAITSFENNEIIKYREGVLPIVRLSTVFGVTAAPSPRGLHVLVVGSDAQATGLVVDRLLGLREIVVRSIADPLVSVPGIGGAAELSDGRVTLILDTAGIVRYAREQKTGVLQRREA